jgi:hypothetical protein
MTGQDFFVSAGTAAPYRCSGLFCRRNKKADISGISAFLQVGAASAVG